MKPTMIITTADKPMMRKIMTITVNPASHPSSYESLLQNQERHHAVSESVR